jgi:hypothetical protein
MNSELGDLTRRLNFVEKVAGRFLTPFNLCERLDELELISFGIAYRRDTVRQRVATLEKYWCNRTSDPGNVRPRSRVPQSEF